MSFVGRVVERGIAVGHLCAHGSTCHEKLGTNKRVSIVGCRVKCSASIGIRGIDIDVSLLQQCGYNGPVASKRRPVKGGVAILVGSFPVLYNG